MVRVRLKSSKTDKMRLGTDIYVGRTLNDLFPVVAMLHYLAVRGFDKHPLFQLADGTPLSRQALVERMKPVLSQAGINSSHYSCHSFRISNTPTAAECEISDATIQRLGRWKSDCYTRYIRPPLQELAMTTHLLAHQ